MSAVPAAGAMGMVGGNGGHMARGCAFRRSMYHSAGGAICTRYSAMMKQVQGHVSPVNIIRGGGGGLHAPGFMKRHVEVGQDDALQQRGEYLRYMQGTVVPRRVHTVMLGGVRVSKQHGGKHDGLQHTIPCHAVQRAASPR